VSNEDCELLGKPEKTMDRRQFLKLASALGITLGAGSALAGCQSAPAQPTSAPAPQAATAAPGAPAGVPTSTPAPVTGQAKRGGTLKFPVDANVTPWPPIGLLQNLLVNKTIFNALCRYSAEDWSPQPDLAEKWEVSKDGLTWTFYLRKGVEWHDGKPFTSADVKFTIELFKDPKVASSFRGNVLAIENVEIVDTHTVKMVTKSPNSALPEVLAYLIFMMPKHLLEGGDYTPTKFPEAFINKPIGTGPFKFQEHVPGDHLTVVANEKYYEGRSYLDSIIFKIVRDGNSRVAQVKTGELDVAFPNLSQLAALQGAANLTVVNRRRMDYRFLGAWYKNSKIGPFFSEKKFRQALAYAIDAKGIIQQVTGGNADRSNGPLPPALKKWYVKDTPSFDYDPNKAGQMLADLGFKKGADGIMEKGGSKLSFECLTDSGQPDMIQATLIMQQNMRDIGIGMEVKPSEFNQVVDAYRVKNEFETISWLYVTPSSPDQSTYWMTGSSLNHWTYSNTEIDSLYKEALSTFEEPKQKELYTKLYTILADDQPVNFLYHPHEFQAISKKVKGWPETHYRDCALWLHKVWLEG